MAKNPEWALKKIKEAEENGLTELYLDGVGQDEKLTEFPESISRLTNLRVLSLGANQLTALPESISRLTNLTELYLSSNQLTELPESVTRLTMLTTLDLDGNQLTEVPESVTRLTNLIVLDLGANQLTALPESISRLTNLTELYLYSNQLTALPEPVTRLTMLTTLDLDDNPITDPPPEVVSKGIEAIREYFKQREEAGVDYIFEAKLLVVGEPGAGKTTLAKKIENPDYELGDEDSTEGIDVIKWEFPVPEEILKQTGCPEKSKRFRVNIWDFGGQEIYHSTHQFFLTKRSLYALIADNRKEDTDFNYWINIVNLLGDSSPLLVIKNEKNDRKRDINEKKLKAVFGNLKGTMPVNLATNRGLTETMEAIKYHMCTLPHVGMPQPKTWVKVRRALEEETRDYISLNEYFDICQRHGFTSRNDKLQLSGFLHDIGVCLHFQDDVLLKKTVILKPNWGTDAVYMALDSQAVIDAHGRFTSKALESIWDKPEYADMHAELLSLMLNFKLCYKIKGSDEEYIAPQLLEVDQPEYDFDYSRNISLRYEYKKFMPKGILSQLIVELNKMIISDDMVWRSGVLLTNGVAKAEVIEEYDGGDIYIRISGKQQKDLMTLIVHQIDDINATYNDLKVLKLVPCNCEQCGDTDDPYEYEYGELVERLNNEKYDIGCGKKPYNTVSVFGLIDKVLNLRGKEESEDEGVNTRINMPKRYERDLPEIYVDARTYVKAEQHQKSSMNVDIDISIEIRNDIKGLTSDFNILKEDMIDTVEDEGEARVLGKELDRVDKAVGELEDLKTKEEAASSGALKRIGAFIKKLDDTSTKAGKAVKAVENGVSYAQDVAKKYNKVAQWCGLPVVPDLFLKKGD